MKVVLAGAGAFGKKHLDGIKNIDGVECVSVVGRRLEPTQAIADEYGIPHATTELSEALQQPGVDSVILATPTQMHAAQSIQCMEAGKHVQVEIPLADTLADAEAVAAKQRDIAIIEAQRIEVLGLAKAEVHRLLGAARATKFAFQVKAFGGDSNAYARYAFAEALPDDMQIRLVQTGEGTFWTDLKGTVGGGGLFGKVVDEADKTSRARKGTPRTRTR